MKVLSGNVNVYDLTGGKTMPYWLKGRQRKEILKQNPDLKNRKIDIIQDFRMPDLCTRVLETADGQHILTAGEYPPRIKCYDTDDHSLKFERGIDNGILDMLAVSDDYTKLVLLEEDRWLELHNKAGRSLIERLPKLGTRIDYHYPDCDVYISTTGPEVYRFNLNEGRMKMPMITGNTANNTLAIHPDHHKVVAIGSTNGTVELWDPENTHRPSALLKIDQNNSYINYEASVTPEITSLCFNKLTLAVGTNTGQVLLYDMRARTPYHVAEQSNEVVKSIKFHSTGNIMSMSSGYLKIWNHETGEIIASITSEVELNDLCSIDNTGMFFMAANQSKVKAYFIPALGEAPKWCSHLDALVEELKEEDTNEYDDYIHVTPEQLKELNLHNTSDGVIAIMNGFKVRTDIYHRMKRITNQLVQEEYFETKVKNKVSEVNRSKLPITTETPKENVDLHTTFHVLAESGLEKEAKLSQITISDDRLSDMFHNPRFFADKEDADYWMLSCQTGKRK